MGPLITLDAYKRIHSYVERGLEEGAELIVDGRKLKLEGNEDGFFVGGI